MGKVMDPAEIKLNEEKFAVFLQKLKQKVGALDAFQLNPVPMLNNERIDVISEQDIYGPDRSILQGNSKSGTSIRPMATTATNKMRVEMKWYGVVIYLNHDLCNDLKIGGPVMGTLGALTAGALGAASVLTAGLAAIVGTAVAAIIGLKTAEIAIADDGNGVYIPITWAQWAPMLATGFMTPVSLGLAAALIHPLSM
ncbi:hypothetical protein [Mesorhizobium sp.]|uniref:hypothetical protein n=1 Tax=Mesorhizobium sp. TaxID=1871066 RepID=UPI000FE7E885|nr:hypothetical protein [Mesorhizobium sp.]RWP64131.1 MAG: hypothetical protein EOR07_16220 [Mesorhizobium sp.]